MFCKAHSKGYREVISGIRAKTLVYGENTLVAEFRMEAGSILPEHSHFHEQTGYLVEGKMHLTIDGQTFEVERGDCWCINGGSGHSAEILEYSVAVEVFSPLREDYLPEGGK